MFYHNSKAFLLMLLMVSPPVLADWPLWQAYQERFIQQDGRVIDYQQPPGITTSEGQAYALFFSLVANQPKQFEQLLHWTEKHLARGNLSQNLPAWLWGQSASGDWQVLDENSASDADIWLAYTLLEAAQRWQRPDYAKLGHDLLQLIIRYQVADLPGLGKMLLPGQHGFVLGEDRWLLNPSYLPPQLFCGLARLDPDGPWAEIYRNSLRLLSESSRFGYASDWLSYSHAEGWQWLSEQEQTASYDAIRVYLWLGMLPETDAGKKILLEKHLGPLNWLQAGNHFPPEYVDLTTGETKGRGPAGFSAALLPYLQSLHENELLDQQQARIKRKSNGALLGEYQHYYDQMLGLFAFGWLEQRYQFTENGRLKLAWDD
ncbi:cellulose synthase complex periplasmic endoglucanase BcsZ [Arsukibacterium sp.]|uniref:cellulose synthase complex periplasmic endoglucanase BcsZ n=1 Tax=Arsukibacterium sp. TaxID=1977258 RepID=UPI00299DE57C|nr:cellulose synthase complex periplasmic endoglucanase BcsZ [Arsukibacterium sp.]MDX1679000.1 cellulose synthase complex periplasmic endoglucanase BcsZ [Arsukibacterium sp.]